MTSGHPTRADLNKDVVRRFYEAVLRVPGGPDFATINELSDGGKSSSTGAAPTAAPTGGPPSDLPAGACTI